MLVVLWGRYFTSEVSVFVCKAAGIYYSFSMSHSYMRRFVYGMLAVKA